MAEHPLAPPGFVWLPTDGGYDVLINVNQIDIISPHQGNERSLSPTEQTRLRFGNGYVDVLLPTEEVVEKISIEVRFLLEFLSQGNSVRGGGDRFVGAGIPG